MTRRIKVGALEVIIGEKRNKTEIFDNQKSKE